MTVAGALRVLQVAPVWVPVPPPRYGGIEWVVHSLSEGLKARSHEVLLVATGDSRASVKTRSAYPQAPPEMLQSIYPELIHALESLDAAEEFRPDVIHDHTLAGPVALAGTVPCLLTAHGPGEGDLGEYYRRVSRRVHLVAISERQRRLLPEARWAGCVRNAVDVSSFRFVEDKDDYVVFLGRLNEDKGAHRAAQAARRAGVRLLIAGRVEEDAERRYFHERVEPLLGDDVEYVGELDLEAKCELLANARALLFPITWEEPFGLVVTEALSSGTPVVAFPRGAVPELLEHGRTGFLVEDVEQMAEAIRRLDQIEPARCRKVAEERFDIPRMVDEYERLYREVLRPG